MNLRRLTLTRELYMKAPFPMEFHIHIFNITNPDEVMKGAKPHLKDIGPYVYKWVEFILNWASKSWKTIDLVVMCDQMFYRSSNRNDYYYSVFLLKELCSLFNKKKFFSSNPFKANIWWKKQLLNLKMKIHWIL